MQKVISIILLVFTGMLILSGLILNSIKNPLNKESNEIPILESTAVYPKFTIPSITDEAAYIIQAKVIEKGDTVMKEMTVSFTENPNEATETISYPITPITLKVEDVIKGELSEDIFVYYEDGGKTSEYIQLPDGFFMEEGMDIILFLNKEGYCWGSQSMFPIINDQVLLNEMALDYVNSDKVSEMETNKMKSVGKEQIKDRTSSVMQTKDFVSMIKTLAIK